MPSPIPSSAIPVPKKHPDPTTEPSTSSPLQHSSPILIAASTSSSPGSISPRPTPPGGRGDLTPTPYGHEGIPSASNSVIALGVNLAGTPSLQQGVRSGSSIRAPSPLRKLDTTLKQWKEEAPHKSPSGWWTKFESRKRAIELEETVPDWQHIRDRVMKAARSVLGSTIEVAHHALNAGAELLEFAPLPGLAPAARTLLEIWDALETVDMNRIACFRLTERCAEILLSVREEIHSAGDEIGEDLNAPILKLIDSFSLVYDLLHKMNRRPFIKRYLKREDMLRQIKQCDKSLTDALGMFSISIQLRILKQVQEAEKARQRDHDAFFARVERAIHSNPPENALGLTGVEPTPPTSSASNRFSSPLVVQSPTDSLPSVDVPVDVSDDEQPAIIVNDTVRGEAGVVRQLRDFQAKQNTLDAAKDLADLRHLMSVALQTSNDAQMLDVLQIGRDEMPEAIKTLQRALEKIIERDSSPTVPAKPPPLEPILEPATGNNKPQVVRRMTWKTFRGRAPGLKRSKTDSSTDSKAVSQKSAGPSSTRDTLDREFIESGLDALNRMSQGIETSLPSWTITRYEVDREEKIGIGFFSDVYKGKWRGRTVAIKVLAETTPRELFVKETEIWKSLRHRNVLELYGASSATSDPPWFFVSPYEKNGSLPTYLKRISLELGAPTPLPSQSGGLAHGSGSSMSIRKSSPARDSLLRSVFMGRSGRQLSLGEVPKELDLHRFMYEIAKGMDYLHNVEVTRGNLKVKGIIHGDLKAANVLIDDRLRCVISDFGQSEMKSEAYRLSGMPIPHGTLRWQAPELMQGAHILTPAMDVYAFAICCVEIMLLGRIPWSSNDDSDVRHLILVENKRPSIPEIPPFDSAALRELIGKCWDRDPAKRPTFSEIVQEIKFIRKNAGQTIDEVHTPQTPPRPMDELPPKPSPDMRPSPLPPIHTRTSEELLPNHHHERHDRLEGVHPTPEPSTRSSSMFTHATSSEDSFSIPHHHGYESPVPYDEQALERKHERRYRLLLIHDFHPSLTLPLWEPTPIKLGAVGYLSKPNGCFVTLFNSFSPYQAENGEARKIPSLHGYGKVASGMQRQDKRNAAQRGLDLVTGFLTFGNGRNVGRRYSFPLRSGHKTAYLCTETTMYRYMESLNAPKRWFSDNVDRILKLYGLDHPITREDLFLVVGTLDSPDHALFVSHRHPDGQVHFDVYAVPRNGQNWGTFTTDTHTSPKIGGPDWNETQHVKSFSATRVSSAGDGWKTVILARLRFKPDSAEPTSL